MDLLQALILGLVEGVTEYLPVSSTGHLLITQRLLGIEANETANGYAIAIQAGAILAVLALYRQRVGRMLAGVVGRDTAGFNLALCVVVAFLPAAVIGVIFDKRIESVLFGVKPIIIAWVAGALVILALSRWIKQHRDGRALEQLQWQHAVIIGLLQCIAMWPGTSRSLVTILGGLAVGLSMSAAVEFSFLLGLLTLTAATAYKSVKMGPGMIEAYGWTAVLAGFAAAALSAFVSVKWMVAWLNRYGLAVFAWWRLAAAALATIVLLHA